MNSNLFNELKAIIANDIQIKELKSNNKLIRLQIISKSKGLSIVANVSKDNVLLSHLTNDLSSEQMMRLINVMRKIFGLKKVSEG